uniref:hypothetical protein n=1 Tax=Ruminococcus bicirculans (ex Wegman et al. 2014) TaxID=1160721 RepID=UPI003FEEA82A
LRLPLCILGCTVLPVPFLDTLLLFYYIFVGGLCQVLLYYINLIKSANNNDEFQIEFYTDKDGKNLGYIESIQLVEKKNSPSYSENISVKENSDLYTVTKSDNSELENICWLIVKDGEIQKIVDASEINEFKLQKDVPEGVYTVLLCTDYDSTTHSYTQVSNAIEIII